jgi:hypothetical protein
MPSNRLNSSQIAGSSSGELGSSERLNAPETPAGLPEERLNTNSTSVNNFTQQQEGCLNNDIREHLNDMFEGLLFLSEREFDAAILGVAERIGMSPIVAYDTAKIIDILCERDGMEDDEAAEFFEFNIAGAYVGDRTPIFIAQIHSIL